MIAWLAAGSLEGVGYSSTASFATFCQEYVFKSVGFFVAFPCTLHTFASRLPLVLVMSGACRIVPSIRKARGVWVSSKVNAISDPEFSGLHYLRRFATTDLDESRVGALTGKALVLLLFSSTLF
jgi:hypothetical protein